MSKAIDVLKLEYNRTLEKEKAGEEYLNKATPEQLPRYQKRFVELVMQLSQLIQKFKAVAGREMTHEEIVYGFGGEKKDG